MKLKHLQSALSSVPTPQFVQPNITLEQYATSPELTSYIIFSALSKHDIGYGRTVLDLGCGTGMLSIGSALVGSSHVLLVDCDEDALNLARENMEAMGFGHDEFVEREDQQEEDCSGGHDDDDHDYDNHDDNNGNSEGHVEHEDDDDKEEQECMVEYILAQVKHAAAAAAASSSTRNDVERNHDIISRGFRTKSGRGGHGRGRGKPRGGRSVVVVGGGGNGASNNNHRDRRGGRASTMNISNSSRTLESPRDIGPLDDGIPLASGCVDTVLTNPPFGTKPGNAGIDVMFLRSAIRLATRAVYSFHKTSTREYLLKTVRGWGYQVSVVAEMKFDIPKMYKFHSKDNVDVYVDLIRVDILGGGEEGVDCVRS